MGVAQGIDQFFKLAHKLQDRTDLGFVFVGRGTEMERFRENDTYNSLDNILFFDQVDPDEIPSLYDQCHIGMLSLDARHKTHNIPGKFLSYISSGLPVLASVNPGNDLIDLIKDSNTGKVIFDANLSNLSKEAELLVELLDTGDLKQNCKNLREELFQPSRAVSQIIGEVKSIKNKS